MRIHVFLSLSQGDAGLVYKFSPLLMQHAPKSTVDMWKAICAARGDRALDPKKLIPALVQYRVTKLVDGQVGVFQSLYSNINF